ncbi:hypothetical protein BXT84_15000 [Sulfobacillus thermotolerans]|uniref:Uncharacterized protein n=1 Tax=Sulfobacillus thermotolerans TaxID=338644 RepID=A0ABM6RUF6_9FIRM|nr:hypothetical protein BXT84_15000 [Sulfobacillus thermotolerans]
MAIRVNVSADTQWLRVAVQDPNSGQEHWVQIDRAALNLIMQEDPRPPEIILDVVAERAMKRMPVANSEDGARVITPHNLELVWPK